MEEEVVIKENEIKEEKQEEKKPKKGLKILIIILVSLILIAGLLFVYFKFIDKEDTNDGSNNKDPEVGENVNNDNENDDSEEIDNDNDDSEENNEPVFDSNNIKCLYDIYDEDMDSKPEIIAYTKEKIDPFADADYKDIKSISDYGLKLHADNNKLYFSNGYEEEMDDYFCAFTTTTKEKIKSVRIYADCGGGITLFWLTYDNKLYSNYFAPAEECNDFKNEFSSSTELLASNVEEFSVLEYSLFGPDTCGSPVISYKSTDNKLYVEDLYNFKDNGFPFVDANKHRIQYLGNGFSIIELFIIPETNDNQYWNQKTYLKDEKGNKIYVKHAFYSKDINCKDSEETNDVLFVITEDNKMYYYPYGTYNDSKGVLYKKEKVRSIKKNKLDDYGEQAEIQVIYDNNKIDSFSVWDSSFVN